MTDQVFYKCVSCGSYDLHRHHAEFVCNECGTWYPIIDDIPIFVINPDKAPSVYLANLDSEIDQLQDLKNIAEIAITKSKSLSKEKRIEQIISGTTWNQLTGRLGYDQNRKSFLRNPEALWSKIPKIVASKQPILSNRKTFSPHRMRESSTLSVIGQDFDIPGKYAQILEKILKNIDGRETVLSIYEDLRTEGKFLVESDYLRLMHCLSFDHYLIAYDDNI